MSFVKMTYKMKIAHDSNAKHDEVKKCSSQVSKQSRKYLLKFDYCKNDFLISISTLSSMSFVKKDWIEE